MLQTDLHFAIESLIKQTYQNFEVILVNDGSTDDSPLLCEDYANNMKISMFSTKKMVDYLMHVTLEWQKPTQIGFFFLDPDDYLEEYTLELIVKIQETHQADLISTKVKATSKYNAYTSLSIARPRL